MMKMKTLSLIMTAIAFGALTLTAAQSTAQDSESAERHNHAHGAAHSKPQAAHHKGYVKPGAAVELLHDYDGQTRIGELETVTLSLSHIYTGGKIHAALIAPEGLTLTQTRAEIHVDLYDAAPLTLPVQFSSSQAGQYNLGVEVVYESPEGEQTRRVLALPILIGDAAASAKTQPNVAAQDIKKSTGGVIALPAQEIIR